MSLIVDEHNHCSNHKQEKKEDWSAAGDSPSSSLSFQEWNATEMQEYLQSAMNILVQEEEQDTAKKNNHNKQKPFQMTLTERHRKIMIRAMLGLKKTQYKEQLRRFQKQQQWKAIHDFIKNHLEPYCSSLLSSQPASTTTTPPSLEEKAPNLFPALEQYRRRRRHHNPDDETRGKTSGSPVSSNGVESQSPVQSPSPSFPATATADPQKFLSSLARGRYYQGNIERLLHDLDQPQLVSEYHKTIGSVAEWSELDWIRHCYVTTEPTTTNNNKNTAAAEREQVALLEHCLDMPLGPDSALPLDGGKALGKRGELNLQTYLESTIHNNNNHKKNENTSFYVDSDSSFLMILSPVWIQERKATSRSSNNNNNHNNNRKKKPKQHDYPNPKNPKMNNILQVPAGTLKLGMTNEFDAMVLRVLPNKNNTNNENDNESSDLSMPLVASLEQVWDAKATLDPAALQDILHKKIKSSLFQPILQQPQIWNQSQLFVRRGPKDGTTTPSDRRPAFQVFSLTTTTQQVQQQTTIDDRSTTNETKNGDHPHPPSLWPPPVVVGLFGGRALPSPQQVVRRLQLMACEHLLETNVDVVRQIIVSSKNSCRNSHNNNNNATSNTTTLAPTMTAPSSVTSRVRNELQQLLQLVQDIQPTVVVVVGRPSS